MTQNPFAFYFLKAAVLAQTLIAVFLNQPLWVALIGSNIVTRCFVGTSVMLCTSARTPSLLGSIAVGYDLSSMMDDSLGLDYTSLQIATIREGAARSPSSLLIALSTVLLPEDATDEDGVESVDLE